MKIKSKQGDNLDLILYRHLGTSYGLLETTLKLNPSLADCPIIPQETEITLPTLKQTENKKTTIQLWN